MEHIDKCYLKNVISFNCNRLKDSKVLMSIIIEKLATLSKNQNSEDREYFSHPTVILNTKCRKIITK